MVLLEGIARDLCRAVCDSPDTRRRHATMQASMTMLVFVVQVRDLKRQLREASRAGPARGTDATVEELQRALREVAEGWPQQASDGPSGQATPQEGEAGPLDAAAAWSKAQLMRQRYLEARTALEALQGQTNSLISVSPQTALDALQGQASSLISVSPCNILPASLAFGLIHSRFMHAAEISGGPSRGSLTT